MDTYAGRELLEVVDGIPIVRKTRAKDLLQLGEVLVLEAGAYEVVRVGSGGADVKPLAGGNVITIATSRAGHRFTTREELAAVKLENARARAEQEDEHTCPNCWPGEVDRAGLGRDPACPNHLVPDEVVQKIARVKGQKKESLQDIERVLELRRSGLSWTKISQEMGWLEDTRGFRSWRIGKENA